MVQTIALYVERKICPRRTLTIAGWLEGNDCAYVEDTNRLGRAVHPASLPQSWSCPWRDMFASHCSNDELVKLYCRRVQA
jgi:hypothetical protein